jgi:transcription elongation GreA/GreB family factor
MSHLSKTKQQLFQWCLENIREKIRLADEEMIQVDAVSKSATKSSMGDKYETTGAMLHLEKEKIATQLHQAKQLLRVMHEINPDEQHKEVKLGSLVFTDQGNFYVAVGIGPIKMNDFECFAISLASPIGQTLKGAEKGNTVSFNSRTYYIHDVI